MGACKEKQCEISQLGRGAGGKGGPSMVFSVTIPTYVCPAPPPPGVLASLPFHPLHSRTQCCLQPGHRGLARLAQRGWTGIP